MVRNPAGFISLISKAKVDMLWKWTWAMQEEANNTINQIKSLSCMSVADFFITVRKKYVDMVSPP